VDRLISCGKSILKDGMSLLDWKTDRKLVVIESDDWGSIRMPSVGVFNKIIQEGINLYNDAGYLYSKYDTLATSQDLECLLEVLSGFQDSSGRAPVFTLISIVANPDFEKIRNSDFTTYYYEPFPETLKKYPGCEGAFALWKEGIDLSLFVPQFHGREHLNVLAWMRALQRDHKEVKIAFNNCLWGISTVYDPDIRVELQAAFDFFNPQDLVYQKEVVKSGIMVFESIFGFRPVLFVPPNGPFNSSLEQVCVEEGIKYISYPRIQSEPIGWGKTRIRTHYLGRKNKNRLSIFIRNCFFEPCQPGLDWVDSCLRDISRAFTKRQPAIISTHRVNYIGALYQSNRRNGLEKLEALLKSIIDKWPDIEFITSEELGKIVCND